MTDDQRDLDEYGRIRSPSQRALQQADQCHEAACYDQYSQRSTYALTSEYTSRQECVRLRASVGLPPCPECPARLCVIGPQAQWDLNKEREAFATAQLASRQHMHLLLAHMGPGLDTDSDYSFGDLDADATDDAYDSDKEDVYTKPMLDDDFLDADATGGACLDDGDYG